MSWTIEILPHCAQQMESRHVPEALVLEIVRHPEAIRKDPTGNRKRLFGQGLMIVTERMKGVEYVITVGLDTMNKQTHVLVEWDDEDVRQFMAKRDVGGVV